MSCTGWARKPSFPGMRRMGEDQLLCAMQLDDAYQVEQVLAEGISGRTELVTLQGSGPYVRKYMKAELTNSGAWGCAMSIDSPCLMHVYQLYSLPEYLVAVVQYVEGPTLEERIRKAGKLDLQEALVIIRDLCRAAALLHAHGVIHRDIAPKNVICTERNCCLIDFGISRMHDEVAKHDTTRLGTWGFSAPEQFGFAQTDSRSDVYSLGQLFAYMLTAVSPDSPDFEATLGRAPWIPLAVKQVVDRARSFEPSARFQDTDEFYNALRAAVDQGDRLEPDDTVARDGLLERAPSTWHPIAVWKDLSSGVRDWFHESWSAGKVGALIASLVFFAFALVVFIGAGLPKEGIPYSPFNVPMALVLSIWGAILPGHEVISAARGGGEYAKLSTGMRIVRVVLRVVESLVVGFCILMVVAIAEGLANPVSA